MLHPSYSDLMKVVNSEVEPGEAKVVNSRYSIVMATAKRARQLIDGDEPMVASPDGKPVSTAVNEIYDNKIKIVPLGQGTVLKIYQKDEVVSEEKKKEIIEDSENKKVEFEDEIVSEDLFDEFEDEELDEEMEIEE